MYTEAALVLSSQKKSLAGREERQREMILQNNDLYGVPDHREEKNNRQDG